MLLTLSARPDQVVLMDTWPDANMDYTVLTWPFGADTVPRDAGVYFGNYQANARDPRLRTNGLRLYRELTRNRLRRFVPTTYACMSDSAQRAQLRRTRCLLDALIEQLSVAQTPPSSR